MPATPQPKLPPVPRLTAAGFEDPVWPRWLNQLRNRVAIIASAVSISTQNGFAGTSAADQGTGEITVTLSLAPELSGMVKGASGALVQAVSGTDYMPALGYAEFVETSTRTAAANTPTGMTWELTSYSEAFDIGTPTTRLVCAKAGKYNIQFSIQAQSPSSQGEEVVIWFRQNGVDLADSAGVVTVPPKHGSTNGAVIASWNSFVTCAVGDYIELYWLTTSGNASIITYPASTSPAYPRSPAAIITFSQVAV